MAFRFKQFSINDNHCGMKVGADSVLLGAWSAIDGAQKVLDAGCGCGLLALMLAQRSEAMVTGIEIDPAAAAQAAQNVLESPFFQRITIVQGDVRTFVGGPFDVVVCNPPYFSPTAMVKGRARSLARETSSLDHAELLTATQRLLTREGSLSVVLPFNRADNFVFEAWQRDLFLTHRCDVVTRAGKSPKRSLMEFKRFLGPITHSVLSLESNEYHSLVAPFYLNEP